MPIALDKTETCPVWLDSDADKPEAERPTFLFHYLTCREMRRVRELMDQGGAATVDAELDPIVREILLVGLAGWRNMRNGDGKDIPYSPDALEDVLTPGEAVELAVRYPHEVTALGAKKKRASTSPSPPASAPSAGGAGAAAATPPPNDPPSSSAASPAPPATDRAA